MSVCDTHARVLQKALVANSTASSFTAKIPTATNPSANVGYQAIAIAPQIGPTYLYVQPYGGNSDNETFDLRIWGWTECPIESIWVPALLLEVNVTLGNISGTAIEANMLMADTIAFAKGDATWRPRSPANDLAASFDIDIAGFQAIEFDFDLTGTADAANAFWRTF